MSTEARDETDKTQYLHCNITLKNACPRPVMFGNGEKTTIYDVLKRLNPNGVYQIQKEERYLGLYIPIQKEKFTERNMKSLESVIKKAKLPVAAPPTIMSSNTRLGEKQHDEDADEDEKEEEEEEENNNKNNKKNKKKRKRKRGNTSEGNSDTLIFCNKIFGNAKTMPKKDVLNALSKMRRSLPSSMLMFGDNCIGKVERQVNSLPGDKVSLKKLKEIRENCQPVTMSDLSTAVEDIKSTIVQTIQTQFPQSTMKNTSTDGEEEKPAVEASSLNKSLEKKRT